MDHWEPVYRVTTTSNLYLANSYILPIGDPVPCNEHRFRVDLESWRVVPLLTRYSLDRRVRPRLGLRHGTPLASRGVPGERGHLSSCILNLGVFSGRCTGGSLPLRVDLIHRVEFGEVSGHRVLTKRGPGNRGASQCGSTHEATSGMSS